MNRTTYYIVGFLLFFGWGVLEAQTPPVDDFYIELGDASGYNTQQYEVQLESAAKKIYDIIKISDEIYETDFADNFRVYDYGFYLHQERYEDGEAEAIEYAKFKALEKSQFYLLFSKRSDKSGIYSKIYVDLFLPDSFSPCYSEQVESLLQNELSLNYFAEPSDAHPTIEYMLENVEILLGKAMLCCPDRVFPSNAKENSSKAFDDEILQVCSAFSPMDISMQNQNLEYILSSLTCIIGICQECTNGEGEIVEHLNETLESNINQLEELNFPIDVPTTNLDMGTQAEFNSRRFDYYKTSGDLQAPVIIIKRLIDGVVGADQVRCICAPEPMTFTFTYQAENDSPREQTTRPGYSYNYGSFVIYSTVDDLEFRVIQKNQEARTRLGDILELLDREPLSSDDYEILRNNIGCLSKEELDDRTRINISKGIASEYPNNWYNLFSLFFRDQLPPFVFNLISDIEKKSLFLDEIKEDPQYGIALFDHFRGNNPVKKNFVSFFANVYNELTSSAILKEAVTIPYENERYLVVFTDQNFLFNYNEDNEEIALSARVCERSALGASNLPITVTYFCETGDVFDVLDPIRLATLDNLNVASFSERIVPALLMEDLTTEIEGDNTFEAVMLTIDLASIALGGGALLKTIKLGKLTRNTATAIQLAEVVTGSTNILLRYNQSCQDNNFCKSFSTFLTILELSLVTKQGIDAVQLARQKSLAKESARKALNDLDELYPNGYRDRDGVLPGDTEIVAKALSSVAYVTKADLLTRVENLVTASSSNKSILRTFVSGLEDVADKTLIGALNQLSGKALIELGDISVDVTQYKRFAEDLVASVDDVLLKYFNRNPVGVKAWEVLDDVPGANTTFRSKINNLESIDGFFAKYPSRIDEFKSVLNDPSLYPDLLGKEAFLNSVKIFDDIPSINNSSQLIEVLSNVREVHRVTDLESKGVNKFFRGINLDANGVPYQGNPNTLANGTSTSSDPIVATIFGVQARTVHGGPGKLLLFEPSNLGSMKLEPPNLRVELEREIIMDVTPTNLYGMKEIEIDVDDARSIIQQITGHPLDSSIPSGADFQALQEAPRMTTAQIDQFYQMALDL